MHQKRKYVITRQQLVWHGKTLHRIKAVKNLPDIGVKAGTLGGWIEFPHNLSQYGTCWVHDNAIVCGGAVVSDHAQIYDRVRVCDRAKVHGNAHIHSRAMICDHADIGESARIEGKVRVLDSAAIHGHAWLRGSVIVGGNTVLGAGTYLDGDQVIAERGMLAEDESDCTDDQSSDQFISDDDLPFY